MPKIGVATQTSILWGPFVDADLDTLATALYARTDDLLKASPERAPWRPGIGLTSQISDAELLTLAVLQALLGFAAIRRSGSFRSSRAAPMAYSRMGPTPCVKDQRPIAVSIGDQQLPSWISSMDALAPGP